MFSLSSEFSVRLSVFGTKGLHSDLWKPGPQERGPSSTHCCCLRTEPPFHLKQVPGTLDSIFNRALPLLPRWVYIKMWPRKSLESLLYLYSILYFTTKPKIFWKTIGEKKSIWRVWKHKGHGRKETVPQFPRPLYDLKRVSTTPLKKKKKKTSFYPSTFYTFAS